MSSPEQRSSLPARRRILIVAMHESVHVARWLRMIESRDAAIVVFPVYARPGKSEARLRQVALAELSADLPAGIWVVRPADIEKPADRLVDAVHRHRRWTHSFLAGVSSAAPGRLRECILRLRPELVHSMEVQLAGYLCLETARRMGRSFPPWILSNWGSDITLFRKLPEHRRRLEDVCRRIDYYVAECARDQGVAAELGYRGPVLPVIPASGGTDVSRFAARAHRRPSERRTIHVKGYHGWSGRGLLSLSAIALARHCLDGYRIEVTLSSPVVDRWVRRLREEFGLDISPAPYLPDHADAIARLADARVVIGTGISDGISTTLLEAMSVGTLPIQSSTACADEWVEHGRTGFIVSPHDTEAIADALVQAVRDDAMVDQAAEINLRTVALRWDAQTNRRIVWEIYGRAAGTRAEAAGSEHTKT